MKTLIAALALSTVSAFAAKVPVASIDYSDVSSQSGIQAEYGINESLGRAWAEITLLSPMGYDSNDTYLRAQVPGLSIVGDQVVLDVDGQQVVCANIRNVGIFHYRVARPTKLCKFTTKLVKTPVDDGYEINIKKTYELSLETF